MGRSIPACAGEPGRLLNRRKTGPVYPRVCGGTPHARTVPTVMGGLSPRVRGNLGLVSADGVRQRSIPACAGEPWRRCAGSRTIAVYPRVCGGTTITLADGTTLEGLSPRVRGNPLAF